MEIFSSLSYLEPKFRFRDYTKWLASSNDVQNGSYLVPNHDHAVALVKDGDIRCVGNICSHKQAIIMKGRGKLGSLITCPVHKWTWKTDGCIQGARGFDRDRSMNLKSTSVYQWKGHLFSGNNCWLEDIDQLGELSDYLDINSYTWHSHHSISYDFDWKIFMEIFLDLYHVKTFHPGLRSLTDCNKFEWTFGKHWTCQTGAFNISWPIESNYRSLYDLYKKTGHYDRSKYGAVWLGIYPNTMIEYYPGCVVVSTVWPDGPGKCINHLEFYYENGLIERFPEFVEVQQKTFMITAEEDEEIGLRMQEGRTLINGDFTVFNHPAEEAGHDPFYEWLFKNQLTGQQTR